MCVCGKKIQSVKGRTAQISGGMSHARQNYVRWRLIFVGRQYGTALYHPSEAWKFEMAPRFLQNLCTRGQGIKHGIQIYVFCIDEMKFSRIVAVECHKMRVKTEFTHFKSSGNSTAKAPKALRPAKNFLTCCAAL